jgi:hypothetical protein
MRDAGVVPSGCCTVPGLPRAPAPTHSAPPARGGAGTPVRQGTRHRLAARTGESLPRGDEREASATGQRQSRRRHEQQNDARTTNDRTSRTTQPLEPSPTPDPTSAVRTTPQRPSPRPTTSSPRRLDGPPTGSRSPQSPPVLCCLGPDCRRPAPAHPLPPGLSHPGFTWTVEEGESGAERRTPLPPKPRREAKETPEAGRRPVALRAETHRAKQMERNTWRETGSDADQPACARRSYIADSRAATTSPAVT